MSSLQIPSELKKITPFIKRAEELDKDTKNAESKLISYYCRQYAVLCGIPLAKSLESKNCLGSILEELEKEKVAMSNFTKDESKFLCKNFANKIFDKADAEDRAGNATKNTARTFYAASTFYEMLQQFYPDSPPSSDEEPLDEEQEEIKNKTVYSKWKSTEILKAIKEGRQPTPGGFNNNNNNNEEEEEEEEDSIPAPPALSPIQEGVPKQPDEHSEEKKTEFPPPPRPPAVQTVKDDDDDDEEEEQDFDDEGTEVELLGPPPEFPDDDDDTRSEVFVDDRPAISPTSIPPPMQPPPPFSSLPRQQEQPQPPKKKTGFFNRGSSSSNKKSKQSSSFPPSSGNKKASNEQIEDAIELTKFALSALQNKDTNLGVSRLQQALAALGQH